MNTCINTIGKETSVYMETLQAVIQAEDTTLKAFMKEYGDGFGEREGLSLYQSSGVGKLFLDMREKLKTMIGNSLEVDLEDSFVPKKEEE